MPRSLFALPLLLACAAASAATQPVSVVFVGEGGSLATAQAANWPLTGATLSGRQATSKDDLVAAVTAATPAQTLVVLREDSSAGASLVVTSSMSAKEVATRIAAALAADGAKSTSPPSTQPAFVEPKSDDALLAAVKASQSPVIVVTAPTSKSTPVSRRARAFRIAIREALDGAYAGNVDTVLPARTSGTTRVGIYDGPGSSNSPGPEAMWGILAKTPNTVFTYVGPEEINSQSLKQFDVVMFPGGSGGGQARAVGPDGRDAIRSFVRDGGAYVGNCAGGYFASTSYDWSLNLLNVTTVDTADGRWARGSGDVQVEFTEDGKQLLKGEGTVTLHYANGPIYAIGDRKDLPPVTVLAYYRSNMAKNKKSDPAAMMNTPAIVAAPYGKGKALAFSCHPEYSKDYTDFIRQALKWVTTKDAE